MIPKLLLNIAKCKYFMALASTANHADPCNDIVDSQRAKGIASLNDFQLPEPWNGDIINAPILVVSSNPAFTEGELFPTLKWPDQMIADFFINRFKNREEEYSWVYKNKFIYKNCTRSRSQPYWSSIKNRVKELINRNPIPGIDYCVTELVHCKSVSEIGVAKALPKCTKSFLKEKIEISGAKIIIAIGAHVRNYLGSTSFGTTMKYNGIPVIFLPAPNAWGKKTLHDHYYENEIADFREILNDPIAERSIEYSEINLPTDDEVIDFIKAQCDHK